MGPPPGGLWPSRRPGDEDDDANDDDDEDQEQPIPQHCSSWHGGEETECKGLAHVNLKQIRYIRMFSEMLNIEAPDTSMMTQAAADSWVATHWHAWMNKGEEDLE